MSAENLPLELRRELVRLAHAPRLLVACDYDGTLAPIVADPANARPSQEAVGALRALATLHETTTAVISGRALRDLATLSRLPSEVHLVGSHGSEFDLGFVHQLPLDAGELLSQLRRELEHLIAGVPGAQLELKPASLAVHVRRVDPEQAERLLDAVRSGPCQSDGVYVTEGKSVIELAVLSTDKGQAMDQLRHQSGATATLFVGDDVTDERAFSRLHGPDVGVKVGEGTTVADHRIGDPTDVACMLAFLVEERRHWLYGEQASPIERLTLLSNEGSVSLLTPDGKVCWMCLPEPDGAAVFADLLGGAGAGHFSITPLRNGLPLGQRYVPGTMTVETRWSRLLLTDYLDQRQEAHRTDLIRVVSGSTTAEVVFAPRPEFGQVQVQLERESEGLRVVGAADPMVLRSPGVDWQISSDGAHQTARAELDLTRSDVVFELRCGTANLAPSQLAEEQRRARSGDYWSDWLEKLTLPDTQRDLIARSALTLRGLCHSETGAIMAAATSSLPEEIGGVRNWDYRYCWLRDAAMTAQALVSLGSLDEAHGYLRWLHRVLDSVPGPERLHPLYTLQGSTLPPEAVIDSLPGYAGSRPVRVGNAANQQVQLDVFGPVVELVAAVAEREGDLTEDNWRMVCAMAEAVSRRWQEPDHGIWEERDTPRHHVYSKVMCWQTIDRALRLARAYHRTPDSAWEPLRTAIADDVLEGGWNPSVGAFTTAYDGDDLDAASLFVGLSGLLSPQDPRFQATVTAIESELRSGMTVYRYHREDGLPGGEGGFHLCASWMIEAYLLTGRRPEAEGLFQQLVSCTGPTGLLSEEYDPIAERSLGNHPQAYSHLGLIRCALLFDELG